MNRKFDYSSLPWQEIAGRYRRGESWRALAAAYGCPDDKTLARHVVAYVPDLEVRDHTGAQRARRVREGCRADTVKRARRWWGS